MQRLRPPQHLADLNRDGPPAFVVKALPIQFCSAGGFWVGVFFKK